MAARAPRDTDRPVRCAARGIAVNGSDPSFDEFCNDQCSKPWVFVAAYADIELRTHELHGARVDGERTHTFARAPSETSEERRLSGPPSWGSGGLRSNDEINITVEDLQQRQELVDGLAVVRLIE